jgi:putative tricarboxylic transport membrane protein
MNEPIKATQGRIGTLICCAFFIIAGLVTLYDSLSYSDIDSKVFPRAAAIVLILCASIAFIVTLVKSIPEEGFGHGIWWRRILLVSTMLLACFAMPYIGFLLSGLISFAGGLIAAMHQQWTKKLIVLYGGACLLTMLAFYTLFRYALHVPLP